MEFEDKYQSINNNSPIYLFSDGGSRKISGSRIKKGDKVNSNDYISAWAYAIVQNDELIYADSGATKGLTNNYQELNGCYHGLEYLRNHNLTNHQIILTTDSKYLISILNYKWGSPKDINKPNAEAGKELSRLYHTFPKIKYQWTKGHAQNSYNNLCDSLCTESMVKLRHSLQDFHV